MTAGTLSEITGAAGGADSCTRTNEQENQRSDLHERKSSDKHVTWATLVVGESERVGDVPPISSVES